MSNHSLKILVVVLVTVLYIAFYDVSGGVTTEIATTNQALIDEVQAYRLSKDTLHDMFTDPVKYEPVFQEILKSQELYMEICLELANSIDDMSEEQYHRYQQSMAIRLL